MMNRKEKKQRNARISGNAHIAHISALACGTLVLVLAACDKKDESEYYRPTAPPGQPPLENPGQIVVTPPEIPPTPGDPENPGQPPLPPPPPTPPSSTRFRSRHTPETRTETLHSVRSPSVPPPSKH